MARNTERTTAQRLADIEHRLRGLERPGCCPPDPGWVLTEVGDTMHFLYMPTGALGPAVGVK